MLLRRSSNLEGSGRSDAFFEADGGDAIEAHEWKCVRTINGIFSFFSFFIAYISWPFPLLNSCYWTWWYDK